MFDVAADAYDRYMGRYAIPLAPRFAEFAGVRPGQRVLDVGAGPGARPVVLAGIVGRGVGDRRGPSPALVVANRGAPPGIEALEARGRAASLFGDDSFGAALAQLVVQFNEPIRWWDRRDGAGDQAGRRRGGLRLGLPAPGGHR